MIKKHIYVGRFSPFHAGHEMVISQMLVKAKMEDIIIVVGSIDKKDYKNIFPYYKRIEWIKTLFPGLTVIGYPDIEKQDKLWIENLIHMMEEIYLVDRKEMTFYGGSAADVFYLPEDVEKVIIDRYSMFDNDMSATHIRNRLYAKQPIDDFVHDAIMADVIDTFNNEMDRYHSGSGWVDDKFTLPPNAR